MGVSLGLLAVRYGCELRGDPDRVVERVATLARSRRPLPDLSRQFRVSRPARRARGPPPSSWRRPTPPVARSPPWSPAIPTSSMRAWPRSCIRRRRRGPACIPRRSSAPASSMPASCEIGPGVVLGRGVVLGERVVLGPRTVLGDRVAVGADTRLMPGVTVYAGVRIGARCVLHTGVVLGSDGFGFAREREGSYVKVPQLGSVAVGDDVEIGANTTVDRGAIDDTVIGNGVKLDNQIQVGHNVRIGEHTVIAAQTGISGSTTIGARCTIGGQAGFAGHIVVADDVVIGGGTSVTGSIRTAGVYAGGGTPADQLRRWRRNMARFGQLDELAQARCGAWKSALRIRSRPDQPRLDQEVVTDIHPTAIVAPRRRARPGRHHRALRRDRPRRAHRRWHDAWAPTPWSRGRPPSAATIASSSLPPSARIPRTRSTGASPPSWRSATATPSASSAPSIAARRRTRASPASATTTGSWPTCTSPTTASSATT